MTGSAIQNVGALVRAGEASLQTGPFGTQLKAAEYVEHGIPVINVRNIGFGTIRPDKLEYVAEATRDRLSAHVLRESDIVFGRKGAVERHLFVRRDQDGWLQGSDCIRLRIESARIVPQFVSYFFLTAEHQRWMINQCSHAATMASLNQGILERIDLPLPPVPVQRQVVGILSAYDDLIENCERRIRVLDEMARALYREWFPGGASTGERVRAQDLIDRRVLEINDGYRAKNSQLGTVGLPFARAGNINGGFLFDAADLLAQENVQRAGSKVSRADDIVFTSKGTVGRFALVRDRTPRFVYSPQLCYWRVLDRTQLSPHFLFRWMQSREFLDQVDGVKGSTDMADYVSLTNQRRMMVRVPSVAEQLRAEKALRPIDEMIGSLADKIANLRRTRDLLLPRLLSGQLSVEGAA